MQALATTWARLDTLGKQAEPETSSTKNDRNQGVQNRTVIVAVPLVAPISGLILVMGFWSCFGPQFALSVWTCDSGPSMAGTCRWQV